MLEPRDSIPLQAIAEKGSLWTRTQISAETVRRLKRRGFIRVVEERPTPKGWFIRERVALTQAGRAALRDPAPPPEDAS